MRVVFWGTYDTGKPRVRILLAKQSCVDGPLPQKKSSRLKLVLHILGAAVAFASTVYFVDVMMTEVGTMRAMLWNRHSGIMVALGACLYLLIGGLSGSIWYLALQSVGSSVPILSATTIYMVSQFGKYLPGNVAHYVGRLVLTRREGVKSERVSVAIILETAGVMLAAAVLSAGAFFGGYFYTEQITKLLPSTSQLVLGASAAIVIVVVVGLLLRLRSGDIFVRVAFRPLLLFVGLQFVVFLVHGAIASFFLYTIFAPVDIDFSLLTTIFALAWLLGFMTPGAPAGVGVRDTVMVLALAPVYTPGVAVTLAGLLRVVSVIGDGLTFGLGLWLRRLERGWHNAKEGS